MLQIVHTVRPAVLYPQASRSLCTQWLRLYPTMQTAMHLQCRVQLLAKSQHPIATIATLNSDSARSQSVGGTSAAAFAASRDALSMLRVSSNAANTQRRPWQHCEHSEHCEQVSTVSTVSTVRLLLRVW